MKRGLELVFIRGTTKRILLIGAFIPKLLENRLASCCLINLGFIISHTAHFDKIIIVPFFSIFSALQAIR